MVDLVGRLVLERIARLMTVRDLLRSVGCLRIFKAFFLYLTRAMPCRRCGAASLADSVEVFACDGRGSAFSLHKANARGGKPLSVEGQVLGLGGNLRFSGVHTEPQVWLPQ